MEFDWQALLTLARELAVRNDEAAKRTAINRAYYAAYGCARRKLVSEQGPIPLDVQTHEYTWRAYRNSGVRSRQFIGDDGFLLSRLRTRADYEANFAEIEAATARSLTVAEKTLRNLASL